MEYPKTVGKRATGYRKSSLWRDRPLQNACIALRTLQDAFPQDEPVRILISNGLNNVDKHRMNDKAVVVVRMEIGTVTIKAIAEIPLFVLFQSVIDPHGVPILFTQTIEDGFDHGRE